MSNYVKIFLLLPFFVLSSHIQSKIAGPDTYAAELKNITNEELKQAYADCKNDLSTPAKEFPQGIETDITWTQKPAYKMERFNVVVKEIARRCEQAQTLEELNSLADLFFFCDTRYRKKRNRFPRRSAGQCARRQTHY